MVSALTVEPQLIQKVIDGQSGDDALVKDHQTKFNQGERGRTMGTQGELRVNGRLYVPNDPDLH